MCSSDLNDNESKNDKKGGKTKKIKGGKSEVKSDEQVMKIRRDKEKLKKKQKTKEQINQFGWKKMQAKFQAEGMARAQKKREENNKKHIFDPTLKKKGRKNNK